MLLQMENDTGNRQEPLGRRRRGLVKNEKQIPRQAFPLRRLKFQKAQRNNSTLKKMITHKSTALDGVIASHTFCKKWVIHLLHISRQFHNIQITIDGFTKEVGWFMLKKLFSSMQNLTGCIPHCGYHWLFLSLNVCTEHNAQRYMCLYTHHYTKHSLKLAIVRVTVLATVTANILTEILWKLQYLIIIHLPIYPVTSTMSQNWTMVAMIKSVRAWPALVE